MHLSVYATTLDWMWQIHHQDRYALNLFSLGLCVLVCCLMEHIFIPDRFFVPELLPTPLIHTFNNHSV